MNKRGQFFLIAALVIVGIVTGLAAVYNTATITREDDVVYDLSAEIAFEGSHLLDYGQLNPGQDINMHVLDIMEQYATANPDIEFSVIRTDGDEIKCLVCSAENLRGVIEEGSGATIPITDVVCQEDTPTTPGAMKLCTSDASGKISALIDTTGDGVPDESLSFDLREGSSFYIILDRQRGGERFVGGNIINPKRVPSPGDVPSSNDDPPQPPAQVCNRNNACDAGAGENHDNCPQDCPSPLSCDPNPGVNTFTICHGAFGIKITKEGLSQTEFSEHVSHTDDVCGQCPTPSGEVITCGNGETFTPDINGYDNTHLTFRDGCHVKNAPLIVRDGSEVFILGGSTVDFAITGEGNSTVFIEEGSTVNGPVTVKNGKLVVRASTINGGIQGKDSEVQIHQNVIKGSVATTGVSSGEIVGNKIHEAFDVCDPTKFTLQNNVDENDVAITPTQTPGICTQF